MAPVGYQEASGAPVETQSPLGYTVGPVTIIFLNLSKMVGTGEYDPGHAQISYANDEKAYSPPVSSQAPLEH
jgi:hypothetical protein